MSTSSQFLTEEKRRQAIGVEGPHTTIDVEKGAIIKFARAIGDDNPMFNDEAAARKSRLGGLVTPPTFLRSVEVTRPELPFDVPFDRRLDGGSDWEYCEPVRPGDRIPGVASITDMSEREGRMGKMIITTTVVTYRNQFNETVATQTTTGIRY